LTVQLRKRSNIIVELWITANYIADTAAKDTDALSAKKANVIAKTPPKISAAGKPNNLPTPKVIEIAPAISTTVVTIDSVKNLFIEVP
jgi:hypothetical protein